MCSLTRAQQHLRENGSFLSTNCRAKTLSKTKYGGRRKFHWRGAAKSTHTKAHNSARLNLPHVTVWTTSHTKDCIRTIGSLRSNFNSTCGQGTLLEFGHLHVVNTNHQVIRNILFIYEVHCTCYRDKSTKKTHLCYRDNAQRRTKSNYQHHFSVNVWCGNNGDQLTEAWAYILPPRTSCDTYTKVLQH